jgi:hypothetical protein
MVLGFYGKYWRRGNLNDTHEWSLAGRKLGTTFVFFLIGTDIYTAVAFVANSSGVFAKGSLCFFAIPFGVLTFGVALVTMPKFWLLSKEKGYITASDFIKDKFGSKTLSILVAITGIVSLLPYIAIQIVGMQSVLIVMLSGTTNSHMVEEISLLVAFVILAAFTYTSGLRGATLTAVLKTSRTKERLPGQFISLKEDKETRTFLFTNYQKIQVPRKDYKTGQTIPGKTVTKYRFHVYDMTTYDPANPPMPAIWERGTAEADTVLYFLEQGKNELTIMRNGQPYSQQTHYTIYPANR